MIGTLQPEANKGKEPMRTRTRKTQRKLETTSIPVNTTPSNETGDRLSAALLIALIAVSTCTLLGGVYFSTTSCRTAIAHAPIDWLQCLTSVLVLAACVLVARSIFGLSFLGSTMLAAKLGAWQTVESVGRAAMRLRKVLPGGSAWLSAALVQSLVNRGQYEDALTVAEQEWDMYSTDDRGKQNLGTICFAAGIANQAQGEFKQAQVWNERSLDILKKSLDKLQNPKKGWLAAATAVHSNELLGQVRMQLAAAYCNSATFHFNVMDYRRAKENYRLSVEHAVKAPEFPQKADIVRFGNEQLSRLKHS